MYAIILAAGKGTRMQSDLPKVLMPFSGATLIDHALKNLQDAELELDPLIVIGHEAEQVKNHLKDANASFVVQTEQLGTGHAVRVCKEHVDPSRPVLVLYGDHVLIRPETIQRLVSSHQKGKATITMVTYRVPHFDVMGGQFVNYGRILRDEDENMIAIREKRDCTEDELTIREVNPAFFLFDGPWLWNHLSQLTTDNDQSELYLTDLVEMAIDQGKLVDTILGEDLAEAIGVNTQEQLQYAEKLLAQREM